MTCGQHVAFKICHARCALQSGDVINFYTVARRIDYNYNDTKKELSYRKDIPLHVWLVMAESGRLELRDNIYGQCRSIINHFDVFGQHRNQHGLKKQNRGHYAVQGHSASSKVIDVGTNRKPVCHFLLVINSNYHHLIPFRRYRSLLFKF